jgi:hypothetical protein
LASVKAKELYLSLTPPNRKVPLGNPLRLGFEQITLVPLGTEFCGMVSVASSPGQFAVPPAAPSEIMVVVTGGTLPAKIGGAPKPAMVLELLDAEDDDELEDDDETAQDSPQLASPSLVGDTCVAAESVVAHDSNTSTNASNPTARTIFETFIFSLHERLIFCRQSSPTRYLQYLDIPNGKAERSLLMRRLSHVYKHLSMGFH